MPLTIFRPSIVIGHRDFGWTTRNGFGFYMFVDALRAFGAAVHDHLTMDLKANIRPDLISIDQLVEDVVALTLGGERRDACEVFHCSGGLGVSSHELMVRFAAAAGVRLSFGRPVTSLEQKFGRAIELNMPFANTEWQFVRNSLDRVLGRAMPPDVLTRSDFSHMIAWYLEQDLHEVEQQVPLLSWTALQTASRG